MAKNRIPFTSRPGRKETIAALAYIPLHLFVFPQILNMLYAAGVLSEAGANLMLYAAGAVYMVCFEWKFLRRDFDPLVNNFLHCVIQICISYGLMLLMNFLVNGLLFQMKLDSNPNNAAITAMSVKEYGKMAALAVFLAPIVEELMFRAGIFGSLRKYSRTGAYVVSILAFSLYHVWQYAIADPKYWIYTVQYIPVSYLLCRCYEKCSSIWGSILFHMVINGISLKVLTMAQEML